MGRYTVLTPGGSFRGVEPPMEWAEPPISGLGVVVEARKKAAAEPDSGSTLAGVGRTTPSTWGACHDIDVR